MMNRRLHCLTNADEQSPLVWGQHRSRLANLVRHCVEFVGPPSQSTWALQQDLAKEEEAWRRSKEEGFVMALDRILSKH